MGGRSRIADVLSYLHDRFSSLGDEGTCELLRGYRAGLTFARVCVVDALTSESLRADGFIGVNGSAGDLRREFETLQGLEDRLEQERCWAVGADGSEFRVGYLAALGIARDHLEVARRMLDVQQPPSGAHRPVRSRSRRSAAMTG
ncbi:hypothetical protein [Gordonia aurantiaca]|uniref:hypothetical protein n=1 Tax=Gordonia sp. B21 TaxID=3151852 RepID=UPI0032633B5F